MITATAWRAATQTRLEASLLMAIQANDPAFYVEAQRVLNPRLAIPSRSRRRTLASCSGLIRYTQPRTLDQALEIQALGVSRIGTSSTAAILDEWRARLTQK